MSELIYTGNQGVLTYNSQILNFSGEILTFFFTGETNFRISAFSYSEADMDSSNVSCDVSVGSTTPPAFSFDWYMLLRGEKFYLRTLIPPVKKDTSSLMYIYTLTFVSERDMLRRFPMANLVATSQPRTDYNFSFVGDITQFAERFNLNLVSYFGTRWQMIISPGVTSLSQTVECSRIKLWDLLKNLYTIYGLRWRIYYDEASEKMTILVLNEITDVIEISHEFEYGANNGLVNIERLNNTEQLVTRLSGRGGTNNVPPSYFHGATSGFPADPDRNEHTDTTFYTNIMPKCYRDYVQGWNGKEVAVHTVAYNQGVADKVANAWNPVDFIDSENIETYGIWQDALEDNEEIYPTIQGMIDETLGRIDAVVDVEAVLNDDYDSADNSVTGNFDDIKAVEVSQYMAPNAPVTKDVVTEDFEITLEDNDISFNIIHTPNAVRQDGVDYVVTIVVSLLDALSQAQVASQEFSGAIIDLETKNLLFNGSFTDVALGNYVLKMSVLVENGQYSVNTVTELNTIKVNNYAEAGQALAYKQTFDIWVKNIWGSTFQATGFETETAAEYAHRIWDPLISTQGDMTIMWSSGLLASEDYEFIITNIAYDTSKTNSHWRLTLKKSDAELSVYDKYLPDKNRNAIAGDHFFFINISLPNLYIYDAENRTQSYMAAQLALLDAELPTFTCKPSKIFCGSFAEVDKLRAGSRIKLKNTTIIGPTAVGFYIRTVTLEYKEDSLLPDWELVISDKIISSVSSVTLLKGDVQRLSANVYTSEQTIATVVRQFDKFFLRKDGLAQSSDSETAFNKNVISGKNILSKDFIPGALTGSGFGLYRDANGNTVFEVDHIKNRKTLSVNELIINQTTFYGGKHLYSAAGMEVVKVEVLPTAYRCYMDTKQGTKLNQFVVNDQAYCQRFAPTDNSVINYYWRKVAGIGTDYIDLSNSDYASGSGTPQVGDNISQVGNRSDVTRQSVLIIDQLNGGSVVQYAGINGYSWANKNYVGYGVNPATGEPYLYCYGDMFFGDRNTEDEDSTWITFQQKEGDTARKVHIKAAVEFGAGSTGISNLSEWPDLNERIQAGEDAAAAIVPAANATQDAVAQSLGYANFAAMQAAVAGGTTVIKNGLINTELLKAFSILTSNLTTAEGTGKRITLSKDQNALLMYDDDNILRGRLSGDDLAEVGVSGTTFNCTDKVGGINKWTPGMASGTYNYGGDNVLAAIAPSFANNSIIIPQIEIAFAAVGMNIDDFANITANIFIGTTLIATVWYNSMVGAEQTLTIPAMTLNLPVGNNAMTISFDYMLYVEPSYPGFEVSINTTFSSATGSINYPYQMMDIAKNGWRVMRSTSRYTKFQAVMVGGVEVVTQETLLDNYGFRITSSGFQKTTDGGANWVAATL